VLSNLVYENADKSAEFIQQLSKIYRYVLDVQQEELVGLDKEISFAENYLSLQKIRFEGSLEYFMDVHQLKGYYLPPLSLQLLLENAIKHNIASLEKPLKIMIEQTDSNLIVRNILQSKLTKEGSKTGIGLPNIKKRYALLSNQIPKITETDKEFIVELPLLKLNGA
jgi:LytS/YehU family sensor histidine kinase